jgi:hypothetical protein
MGAYILRRLASTVLVMGIVAVFVFLPPTAWRERSQADAANSACSPPPCGEGLGVGVQRRSAAVQSLPTTWRDQEKAPTALRFSNLKVITATDSVLEAIYAELTRSTPTPNPSPQGGGESRGVRR